MNAQAIKNNLKRALFQAGGPEPPPRRTTTSTWEQFTEAAPPPKNNGNGGGTSLMRKMFLFAEGRNVKTLRAERALENLKRRRNAGNTSLNQQIVNLEARLVKLGRPPKPGILRKVKLLAENNRVKALRTQRALESLKERRNAGNTSVSQKIVNLEARLVKLGKRPNNNTGFSGLSSIEKELLLKTGRSSSLSLLGNLRSSEGIYRAGKKYEKSGKNPKLLAEFISSLLKLQDNTSLKSNQRKALLQNFRNYGPRNERFQSMVERMIKRQNTAATEKKAANIKSGGGYGSGQQIIFGGQPPSAAAPMMAPPPMMIPPSAQAPSFLPMAPPAGQPPQGISIKVNSGGRGMNNGGRGLGPGSMGGGGLGFPPMGNNGGRGLNLGTPSNRGRGLNLGTPSNRGRGLNLGTPSNRGRGLNLGTPSSRGRGLNLGTPSTQKEQTIIRKAGGSRAIRTAVSSLKRTNGNISRAMNISGLPRETFNNLKKLGSVYVTKHKKRKSALKTNRLKTVVHKVPRKNLEYIVLQWALRRKVR